MKKKTRIIIIILAILVVAGGIWFFVSRKNNKASYQLETATMSKNNVSVMVTATGTIEPITKVDVGTQVSGIIDKIYVDYNSEVTKGEVLAELDKTTLQSDLRSKEMELQSAKTEYDYQKTNYNRLKALFDQELISRTDFETSQYNYQKAEAAYNKLISDLVKVRTNLGYATIYSPIDGVVLSRAVEEGQTVAASFNTPTLFTIANDLTKMQVTANVDEADIGEVQEGQRVTFTVDAYPSDLFEGDVIQVRLEPTTTSSVVTYEVIVNAPNPDLKLKPGLTANITIYTVEKDDINTLPNKAFIFRPDQDIASSIGYQLSNGVTASGQNNLNNRLIWVVNQNTLNAKYVVVGHTDGVNTEIVSGLSQNDVVATGIVPVSKSKAKNGNGQQSPFMPQRRGGGGPR